MTDSINNYQNSSYTKSSLELEMLAALLAEDSIYPWDGSNAETEAYFIAAEQEFGASWQAEETSARSHSFLSQLDRLWQAATPANAITSLQAKLRAQFADRLPQNWLDAIAQQARQAIATQETLAGQLVECVQQLLPNFGAEDLQVLARPYAYAMRSSSNEMPKMLGNITPEKWATLSEVQQAKVTLAIARYALEQLQADEEV